MSRFAQRSMDIEIMDDLMSSGEVVNQTLRELETINRFLGGNQVTLSGIEKLLGHKSTEGEMTMVDWGCGGGDMLKLVADWGRRKHIPLRLTGIDANPHIISFAAHNCRAYKEIQFESENVLSEDFSKRNFDVVLATLFTHHFTDNQLIDLIRVARRQARIGIVINDIHRHWFAYFSISLLTHFFSKSTMVRFDAPLSVLRAFRRSDWKRILAAAGISDYSIQWKWAFRWQVILPTS